MASTRPSTRDLASFGAPLLATLAVGVAAGALSGMLTADPHPLFTPFVEVDPQPPSPPLTGDELRRWGRTLMTGSGCFACHRTESDAGPAIEGTWGEPRGVAADGSDRRVDREYFEESVFVPQAFVVPGFDVIRMPAGRFSDRQIDALLTVLKASPTEDPDRIGTGVYVSDEGEAMIVRADATFELRAARSCNRPTNVVTGTIGAFDAPWPLATRTTIDEGTCTDRSRPRAGRRRFGRTITVRPCDADAGPSCVTIDGDRFARALRNASMVALVR